MTPEQYQDRFRIAYSEPAYPPRAERERIEGTVVLDAAIGKDGRILDLSVRSGHAELAEAALETVRNWTYCPLKVNGVPVEVETLIEVAFRLPSSASDPSTAR